MKYKGKELKEITTPQIVDPPKEMLVWSDEMFKMNKEPQKEIVYAVVKLGTHYVAITSSYQWDYCAEIPEEPKSKRATNRELSMWLAQGKGEKLYDNRIIETNHKYDSCNESEPVNDYILIRKWDDTDWHEPTVDYMGIEDPAQCGSKMPYFTEPDYFKKTEVKIGNQTWMNKNLDVSDGGEGIFYNEENGEYYYTWDAAKRIADKIPGWHLPSREEWNELVKFTGYDATNLREKSWEGTDKYGFSAGLAGYLYNGFYDVGFYAYFWTSEPNGSNAWSRYIDTGTSVNETYISPYLYFSVRLVKDK